MTPPGRGPADVVVWADGGARGNPGPAGYGAVVATPDGQVLAEEAKGIGWATNNVAEYQGVIAGLRRARDLGARRVRVRADSLLVVNQQKGLWKVKNAALRPLSEETARLARTFDRVTWEHVPRERNRRADALANQAMDHQGRVEEPEPGEVEGARPGPGSRETQRRGPASGRRDPKGSEPGTRDAQGSEPGTPGAQGSEPGTSGAPVPTPASSSMPAFGSAPAGEAREPEQLRLS